MNFNIAWAKTVLEGSDSFTEAVIQAFEILSDTGYTLSSILALYKGNVTIIEFEREGYDPDGGIQ